MGDLLWHSKCSDTWPITLQTCIWRISQLSEFPEFTKISSIIQKSVKLTQAVSQVKGYVSMHFICSSKSPTLVIKWLEGFWNPSTYAWNRGFQSSDTRVASPCRIRREGSTRVHNFLLCPDHQFSSHYPVLINRRHY